ncbi:transglycosylase domain-containing protein [Frondihabitans cladoniiphilus]|uniref:Transglycosylase domain-containing protein n=1 Tax=Frondihabitans cladoniiphilus TaxID=715785 RepID=A0ABP8W5H2_9MICO
MIGAIIGFAGLSVVAGALVAALFVPGATVASNAVTTTVDTFDSLPSYLQITPPAQASSIYAKQGGQDVKIATFYSQNRTDVASADIAQVFKESTVATEDPRFYDEGAIDVQGTLRGAISTALHKGVQGGSSITQQYVKNVLVNRCEQQGDTKAVDACYSQVTATTPARKLREMRYAIGVEKKYSKDEILRGYSNLVGFGGTVYGVQAASLYYFNVSAKDLSLVQAATLTAIINNPTNLRIDQPTNVKNGSANGYALTLARRNYVLDRMYVNHYIDKATRDATKALPVTPAITPSVNGCESAIAFDAAYFCKYVELSVLADPAFGSTQDARNASLDGGGLSIYTTLNLDLQKVAQTNVSAYMPTSIPGVSLGASQVSVEPGTGKIITMVQNTNFDETSTASTGSTSVNYNTDYDRGRSEGFQTGSSFKAFTLAAWLEAGHTLNENVNTATHYFPGTAFKNSCANTSASNWNVANADPAPANMTVLAATADSVNSAYARMGTSLDLCKILDVAKGMDIHAASPVNPLQTLPTMIIGTNYIAPLAMATAYAGIANNGVVCTPVAITSITSTLGTKITPTPTSCTQGMPADIAHGVSYALQTVLKPGGTGAAAQPGDGVPIIAKTGTTDAATQNWLVTSTSRIAQATWVGNIRGKIGFYKYYVNGVYGYSLKFLMDKPIIQALNKAYGGGDAFIAPPANLIGSVAPAPTTAPTPGTGTGSDNGSGGNGNGNGGNNDGGGAGGTPNQ